MYTLKVILASTRPERKGPAVTDWIFNICKKHNEFESELLDLEEINLPFLDEPHHPRLKQYTKEHTRKWSETINKADAFIFVTCEYNHGYPAPLKNAIDFLYSEWNHKPVAFVSYGGLAGGTRSVQQLKPVVAALSMMAVNELVNIPFFTKHINEEGVFEGDEILNKTAEGMLGSLFT